MAGDRACPALAMTARSSLTASPASAARVVRAPGRSAPRGAFTAGQNLLIPGDRVLWLSGGQADAGLPFPGGQRGGIFPSPGFLLSGEYPLLQPGRLARPTGRQAGRGVLFHR